jgi:hypothetical protein
MKNDTPLIMNNNHAVGVTDEGREITLIYKQRKKHAHFVKPVNLCLDKGRQTNHRTGIIK